LAITECEEARGRAADVDHDQKKRSEGIDPEMSSKPWQAERQCYGGRLVSEETDASGDSQRQR
jgi:hypothetical protein